MHLIESGLVGREQLVDPMEFGTFPHGSKGHSEAVKHALVVGLEGIGALIGRDGFRPVMSVLRHGSLVLGKSQVGGKWLREAAKLTFELVGLEAVNQTGQPTVPGMGRVGMLLKDSPQHLDSFLGVAVVNQSQADGHAQREVFGMLARYRLENLHR